MMSTHIVRRPVLRGGARGGREAGAFGGPRRPRASPGFVAGTGSPSAPAAGAARGNRGGRQQLAGAVAGFVAVPVGAVGAGAVGALGTWTAPVLPSQFSISITA